MAQFTLPGMKYIGCIGTSSCVVGGEKPSYPCGSKAHFVCDCLIKRLEMLVQLLPLPL